MLASDWIAAFGSLFTGIAAIAAALTWLQYRRDQHRQRAAQTREALQAIIGDCSQFLRPLSEQYPYPILHTATAITSPTEKFEDIPDVKSYKDSHNVSGQGKPQEGRYIAACIPCPNEIEEILRLALQRLGK